jgi:hypothetical protein
LLEIFFLFDRRPLALRRQFSLVLPFLLLGSRTILALAACEAGALDSWLCVAGFRQFCGFSDDKVAGQS